MLLCFCLFCCEGGALPSIEARRFLLSFPKELKKKKEKQEKKREEKGKRKERGKKMEKEKEKTTFPSCCYRTTW